VKLQTIYAYEVAGINLRVKLLVGEDLIDIDIDITDEVRQAIKFLDQQLLLN